VRRVCKFQSLVEDSVTRGTSYFAHQITAQTKPVSCVSSRYGCAVVKFKQNRSSLTFSFDRLIIYKEFPSNPPPLTLLKRPTKMACLLLTLWIVTLFSAADTSLAFLFHTAHTTKTSRTTPSTGVPTRTALHSKKKSNQVGKGFGKTPVVVEKTKSMYDAASDLNVRAGQSAPSQKGQEPFLTSVPGASDAIPTIDDSVPVQERNNAILRDKYGLRTREEQQAEFQRQQQVTEQRKKLKEWKEMADRGEDFDIIQVLPGPVLIFIDRFLKAGVAICTVLFVAAGLGITVEAGSKATGNPLPENVDAFITNVVEPNFTPGLLVLLGFSVSLGAFAALQLGSSTSTYREDR
jgi:hypothetical protein